MATNNVRFFFTSDKSKFDNLVTKDPFALYFIEEANGTTWLFKGENLIAMGITATSMANGLMSSADKQNLDDLVTNAVKNLTPVDGSIVVADGNKIGVAVSAEAGNSLSLKSDGL